MRNFFRYQFSYTRNPWRARRYRMAECAEMLAVHRLYAQHLQAVFGEVAETELAWQDARCPGQPHLGVGRLGTVLPEQPASPIGRHISDLLCLLQNYLASRQRRWFGRGYSNDPQQLLCVFIGQTLHRYFGSSCLTSDTIKKLSALLAFIVALQTETVFPAEFYRYHSLHLLLYRLQTLMADALQIGRERQRLTQAREVFDQLIQNATLGLDGLIKMLFYVLSDQTHKGYSFSALAVCKQDNDGIQTAMHTIPGTLLNVVISQPTVQRILTGAPMAVEVDMPAVNAYNVHDFYSKNARPTSQDPAVNKAIVSALQQTHPKQHCPNTIPSMIRHDETILGQFTQLHPLLMTYAHYIRLLEALWHLAGLGGDILIYQQLNHLTQALVTEFLEYTEGLIAQVQRFCSGVHRWYGYSLTLGSKHKYWRANYRLSQQYKLRGIAALQNVATQAGQNLAHMQHLGRQQAMTDLMQKSVQVVQTAQTVVDHARWQMGRQTRALPSWPATLAVQRPDSITGLGPVACRMQVTDQLKHVDDVSIHTYNRSSKAALRQTVLALTQYESNWVLAWQRLSIKLLQGKQPPWYRLGKRACYQFVNEDDWGEVGLALADVRHEIAGTRADPKIFGLKLQRALCTLSKLQSQINKRRAGLFWPLHRQSMQYFKQWQRLLSQQVTVIKRLQADNARQCLRVQHQKALSRCVQRVPTLLKQAPNEAKQRKFLGCITHLYSVVANADLCQAKQTLRHHLDSFLAEYSGAELCCQYLINSLGSAAQVCRYYERRVHWLLWHRKGRALAELTQITSQLSSTKMAQWKVGLLAYFKIVIPRLDLGQAQDLRAVLLSPKMQPWHGVLFMLNRHIQSFCNLEVHSPRISQEFSQRFAVTARPKDDAGRLEEVALKARFAHQDRLIWQQFSGQSLMKKYNFQKVS